MERMLTKHEWLFQVGNLIKEERVRLGLTQEAVARRSKLQQSVLSRLERGQADPRLSDVYELFQLLNLELAVQPIFVEPDTTEPTA